MHQLEINHRADGGTIMHVIKGLVDLVKRQPISNELINLDRAVYILIK